MTERAKELGCTNTNFVNANGLFDENHYTTAHDMALIARELLKHEEYRSMMSETDYEIPPTNLQTETRYLHGQHQMLNPNSIYYYKDAIGGKTGYTVEAGNTLVTYAERDGLTLIAVVMKCNGAEHYTDTAALFDYGFANYASVKVAAVSDYTSTVPVTETYNKKAVDLGKVTIAPSEDVYYTLPKGTDASAVTIKTDIPEGVEGAVKKGQTLGTLQLSYDGKTQTVDLIAQNAVDALTDTQKAELDKSSLSGIVKMNAETKSSNRIFDGDCWMPIVDGNTAYYMDCSNNYCLTKVNLNTKETTVLTNERVDCFNVYGSTIYYCRNQNPALCRMQTDGSDSEVISEGIYTDINITSQFVYFRRLNENDTVFYTPTTGAANINTFHAGVKD